MNSLPAITAALWVSLAGAGAGWLDSLGFGKKATNETAVLPAGLTASRSQDQGVGGESMDVDAYGTNKALDGLFKMVGEEQLIRQEPAARTTALHQKVFRAVSK